MMRRTLVGFAALTVVVLITTSCTQQTETPPATVSQPTDTPRSVIQSETRFPMAEIQNDEGGIAVITGQVEYTYPFFTIGVAEPIIILEDQAGFVDRDRNFIFPVESQVLGQITSDFFTSPFSYSLTLPLVPRGTLRDVDQDDESNPGLMVFAVAYWTNVWGDPYLEKRDQSGGGWSSAYASTRIDDDRDQYLEVYGGKYLVYSQDDQQGFPSGFGADNLLFTPDDPIVQMPQGWTVVDLDTDPFTFDRSKEPSIDLLEPESLALDDYSDLSYTEAFEAMLEMMRTEYAFSEYKGIDWVTLADQFRPLFDQAEQTGDIEGYMLALLDFLWSIPDGHINMDTSGLGNLIRQEITGGLGMAIRELEDGMVVLEFIVEDGPADNAGLEFAAEVVSIDGIPINEALRNVIPWSSPFSTEHNLRLEQARFVTRFPLNASVEVEFRNPSGDPSSVTIITVQEFDSFFYDPTVPETSEVDLPVEFELQENGFGYVRVTDFFDNELLTIQLWERMIQDLNENQVPGLVIDLRSNGGGSGYLADQMAAYFFDEELVVGNTGFYDDSTGEFYTDPGDEDRMFLPREDLRYHGSLVVIVGPNCASACEFFAYDLTIQDRATILGQYPSAGLGGSVKDFTMPEDINVRFTIGRAVDVNGDIHIEGIGVVPDIWVPVTIENVVAKIEEDRDVLLEEANKAIRLPRGAGITPSGPPRMGSLSEIEDALVEEAAFLEQLAMESYEEELFEPATLVYTIPLGKSQDVLWFTSWCATPELLDQNWDNIRLDLSLNGDEVSLDPFLPLEFPSGEVLCRYFIALLTDWPAGEHLVRTEMEFTTALDDGVSLQTYAPGSRVHEYHVYVVD